MGVDPVTIGLGTMAVASAYGAYSSKRAADKQERANKKANQVTAAEWERYMGTFAPLEDQAIEEAKAPVEEQPGFSGSMGAIDRTFSDRGATIGRIMGGRYQYGSGLERSAQMNNEMQRGRAKAGLYSDYATQRANRMMSMASIGRGIPANVSQFYQNQGNMYGNMSTNSASSAGNTMGDLMLYYMLGQKGGGKA